MSLILGLRGVKIVRSESVIVVWVVCIFNCHCHVDWPGVLGGFSWCLIFWQDVYYLLSMTRQWHVNDTAFVSFLGFWVKSWVIVSDIPLNMPMLSMTCLGCSLGLFSQAFSLEARPFRRFAPQAVRPAWLKLNHVSYDMCWWWWLETSCLNCLLRLAASSGVMFGHWLANIEQQTMILIANNDTDCKQWGQWQNIQS